MMVSPLVRPVVRRFAVVAVEAVAAVDEAAHTTHGPAGIGEQRVGLKSRRSSYTEVKGGHNS